MIDFNRLKEPFPEEDIEWRIAERGSGSNGQWAKVLAYVTNRAIMNRLDEVCGEENWCNAFQHIDGAFLCGIGLKIGGEWVMKWDGAQESQIEATKGGISGAMKRAAVQWGIGRYLYCLDAGWADICQNGKHYAGKDERKRLDPMKWNPPKLPAWALPGGKTTNTAKNVPESPPVDRMPSQARVATNERIKTALKTIFGDNKEAALDRIEQMTTFTPKGGKTVHGKRDYTAISDKQADIVVKRLEDEIDELTDNRPEVNEDGFPF